ncbi:toll/interleukin-1 receptor-like protein [Vigna radiata var. radiata]|uniref:Toll/interleukin-1 receptor-like protein n=1 Tax=Vigna radiata var. radiata TaxID=3916 RepID=A0A3Q0FBV8_VIGRR|nr:toll/interleukin-1 receptor-like protein [Vigna radiata var. radiata]
MAIPSFRRFIYDVFLSFRGEDTRYGFTSYLYKALCDRGVRTFIDDEELQSGEEITPALQKAIEESRIAIVVLSHNYASSSFCLDELATILHCKSKGLLVIPVFYKVDPSNVRHQKGSYEEALAKHQKRFKGQEEKLDKWKMALREVADLSGYHLGDGEYQYKFIEDIVKRVSKEIKRALKEPVGLILWNMYKGMDLILWNMYKGMTTQVPLQNMAQVVLQMLSLIVQKGSSINQYIFRDFVTK